MKQHIKWPLIGYKKENGFLGIVSKDRNEVHFFTKSSDDGDYVNWFIGVLCDNYNLKYLGTRYTDIYNHILFLNTQENCNTSTKATYLQAQSQMIQELKNKLNFKKASSNDMENFLNEINYHITYLTKKSFYIKYNFMQEEEKPAETAEAPAAEAPAQE